MSNDSRNWFFDWRHSCSAYIVGFTTTPMSCVRFCVRWAAIFSLLSSLWQPWVSGTQKFKIKALLHLNVAGLRSTRSPQWPFILGTLWDFFCCCLWLQVTELCILYISFTQHLKCFSIRVSSLWLQILKSRIIALLIKFVMAPLISRIWIRDSWCSILSTNRAPISCHTEPDLTFCWNLQRPPGSTWLFKI